MRKQRQSEARYYFRSIPGSTAHRSSALQVRKRC